MSMSTLLQEVRSALTGYSGLTALIPANKITFARRPQRDQLPGLTVSLGNVDYEPVTQSYAAATTYRVDITVFGESAQATTAIHDQVKLAMLAANSQNFRIRIFDERYFVDVDNVHQGYVSATWEMDTGVSTTDTVFLSPAFAGHDKMSIKYYYQLRDNQTTVLSTSDQVYFLELKGTSGAVNHNVQLPSASENLGKIYTLIFGQNLASAPPSVDTRSFTLLRDPNTTDGINGTQSFTVDKALSSVSLVAVRNQLSPASYMWRLWSSYGLDD